MSTLSMFVFRRLVCVVAATMFTVVRLETADETGVRECGHSDVMLAMATCQKERQKLSFASQGAHTIQLCRDLQRYSDCLEPRIRRCQGSANTAFDVITERYSRHPYNCKIRSSDVNRKDTLGSTFEKTRGTGGGKMVKSQPRKDVTSTVYSSEEEKKGEGLNATTDTAETNNKTTRAEDSVRPVEASHRSSTLIAHDDKHPKPDLDKGSQNLSLPLDPVETNVTGTPKAKRLENIEGEGKALENIAADKKYNNNLLIVGYILVFLLSYLYI